LQQLLLGTAGKILAVAAVVLCTAGNMLAVVKLVTFTAGNTLAVAVTGNMYCRKYVSSCSNW
jgi:hypothetical protein